MDQRDLLSNMLYDRHRKLGGNIYNFVVSVAPADGPATPASSIVTKYHPCTRSPSQGLNSMNFNVMIETLKTFAIVQTGN